MPKFDITIGAKLPAYATVQVEAATLSEAWRIATRIAREGWCARELRLHTKDPVYFDPEHDAMGDFTAQEVVPVDESGASSSGAS